MATEKQITTHMKYLLLLGFVAFISCKKDFYQDEFAKSRRAFNEFKLQHHNSYTFEMKTYSWTNFSTSTTITVKAGKIIARDYIAMDAKHINGAWQYDTVMQYSETAASINSNLEGLRAVTLEEVYNKAENQLLKIDKKTHTIQFETKNNGLISTVGYTPKECVDDCFRGYIISRIEALSE